MYPASEAQATLLFFLQEHRGNMSGTRATYKRLWSNQAFRGLLLAHFASNLGDWLAFIALFNLAAIEWQTDILGIGLITVAYLLPFAIIAPVAGVFVDRWELRRLLVASDILRAGLVVLMVFADQLWQLCLLIFLHQTVSTFFNPAQQAAIPRLVRRADILPANALGTQASHLTKVLGPGIAGMLVAMLGTRGCLLLDAATFALSGMLLLTLPRLTTRRAPQEVASVSADLRAAYRCLRKLRRLQWSLLSLIFAICGLGAFLVALPIHARDGLGLGPQGLGLLLSTLGIGTLVGAMALMSRLAHHDRLSMMSVGSGLLAISLVGLVRVQQPAWSGLLMVFLGVGTAFLIVPAHALFQEEAAEQHLGGILSVALAVLALAQVSGMGMAAALGQTLPASYALGLAAALCGCAALLLWGGVRFLDLGPRRPSPITPEPITPEVEPVIRVGDRG